MDCEGCAKTIEKAPLEGRTEFGDEIKRGWQRFWLGFLLTIPVFVIEAILKKHGFYWHLSLFVLATPVQVVLGWPFYRGAYYPLKQKMADLNVLVSLSSSAAYFYSVAATFFIKGPVFYEASTTVLTIITLGMLLERVSRGKVGRQLKN